MGWQYVNNRAIWTSGDITPYCPLAVPLSLIPGESWGVTQYNAAQRLEVRKS